MIRQTGYLERSEIMECSIRDFGCAIVCHSLDEAAALGNEIAPEHLEVVTADPEGLLPKIKNAGAVFLGSWSPEPLGDYLAGPDHVLPTSGTARFAAGLGVHTFMKPVEVIEYDEQGLKELASRVNAFAVSEDLPAHGESVLTRFVADPYDKETLTSQEEEAGLR